MAKRKLRLGIVGIGGVARGAHLPVWSEHPDVEIVGLADIRPERARAAAEQYGVPKAFDDHRRLLRLPGLDAVDVCTPNMAHTSVARNALKAGKHVLCEKPLSTTPARIRSLIEAARKSRRILTVIQNHRFTGMSRAVKTWIDAGNLGKPYYARAWAIRRNLLPPSTTFISRAESGGGPCMDIGVHALDLAMWLMDFPEPISVSGTAGTHLAHTRRLPGAWGEWDRRKFDVEDFACGLVRFGNGAMLSLESSWLGHTPEPENFSCMVLGDKAGVSWPSGRVCTSNNGVILDTTLQPLPLKQQGHALEIDTFVRAVLDGRASPVPAEQTLKVIRILDGVYRSRKLGREVRV